MAINVSTVKKSISLIVRDVNTNEVKKVVVPSSLQVGLKGLRSLMTLFGSISLSTRTFIPSISGEEFDVEQSMSIVNVDSTNVVTGTVYVRLPFNPHEGQLIIIKDSSGTGDSCNVTIVPFGDHTIDGTTSKTITTEYGFNVLCWVESGWFTLVNDIMPTVTTTSTTTQIVNMPDSSYVTINNEPFFSQERSLRVTNGLTLTSGTSGSFATVGTNITSNLFGITTGSSGQIVVSQPTSRGLIRYHTMKYDPVVLYQFSGTLNDSGPNQRHLTIQDGTALYTSPSPNFLMFTFNGSTRLIHNTVRPELLISGSLTVEYIVVFNSVLSGSQVIVSCTGGAIDTLEEQNYLYRLALLDNNTGLNYFAERNVGENISFEPSSSIACGMLHHFAMVRTNDGQVTMYVNGEQIFGGKSTGLLPPTGGATQASASQVLMIGGDGTGAAPGTLTSPFIGSIASVKILTASLTPTQVWEEFAYTLGPMFGASKPEGYD